MLDGVKRLPRRGRRSEHRPSQGTGSTRSRVNEARTSLHRPTRDEHQDRRPAHHRQAPRPRGNRRTNAFAYQSFVRCRTIRIDPTHASPIVCHHPALLPDQRLHQLPGAAARARPGGLPGVRLHPAPALIPGSGPDGPRPALPSRTRPRRRPPAAHSRSLTGTIPSDSRVRAGFRTRFAALDFLTGNISGG